MVTHAQGSQRLPYFSRRRVVALSGFGCMVETAHGSVFFFTPLFLFCHVARARLHLRMYVAYIYREGCKCYIEVSFNSVECLEVCFKRPAAV